MPGTFVPIAAFAALLLGLASCADSSKVEVSARTAILAIPNLEVDYPVSYDLDATKSLTDARSTTGTVLDLSSLEDIRSEAWIAFKREVSNPDGPDLNNYIRRFQAYVRTLASVPSGSTLEMPSFLGRAEFETIDLEGGGLQTRVWWTLPHRVSAATVARITSIQWPPGGADGTVSITFHVYMDIRQDAAGGLLSIALELASLETCLPAGETESVPLVQISARKDRSAGTYELTALYYGNMRHERSTVLGEAVTFEKEVRRPQALGTDHPKGREYYYYGYGTATIGGITYLDYDPNFAADPASGADIALHREIFDSYGHLLFKQHGLTNPGGTKLLGDFAASGVNLAPVLSQVLVSAGAGTGTVTTGPWKIVVTYSLNPDGSLASLDAVARGGSDRGTSGITLSSGAVPQFYYRSSVDSWSPGDAVYYPEGITEMSGCQITQVFLRGYTVPNAAPVLGIPFFVDEKYPLKYLALSANLDPRGAAYDDPAAGYAFYDWLGAQVTGIVWYDLAGGRHEDGSYFPKTFWISQRAPTGGQLAYEPALGDIKISGVEMHRAFRLGSIDPGTGLPATSLEYVPVLSTTALSAADSSELGGAVASGYYRELPLFLSWATQASVEAVIANLESLEGQGALSPGELGYAAFLALPAMISIQDPSTFPD